MIDHQIHAILRQVGCLRRARQGVAAVEFIMLAPVLFVMILAVVDLGNVLYAKFRLTDGVAAASTYALTKAADISTSSAHDVAQAAATLAGNSNGPGWARATVVVNNGPIGTSSGDGASATNTNPSTTNGLCYCPTSRTDFGSSKICGIACGSGGTAGRYVIVTARRSYSPVFSSYGVVGPDGFITISQMVQTE